MRLLSLLLLSVILGKGCSDPKELKQATLEYTANTRGFYQKILVQNQQMYVSKDRNSAAKGTKTVLSDADWNQLVAAFSSLELEKLSTYKAPSEKRFYDGAAIAKLKVTYEGKVYESVDFDHGAPPKEIEKLVNKVVALAQEKE